MTKAEFITKWRPELIPGHEEFIRDLTSLMQLPGRDEAEKWFIENEIRLYSEPLRIEQGLVYAMAMYDWLTQHREQPEAKQTVCQCSEGPSGRTVDENWNRVCDRCGKPAYIPQSEPEQPAKPTPTIKRCNDCKHYPRLLSGGCPESECGRGYTGFTSKPQQPDNDGWIRVDDRLPEPEWNETMKWWQIRVIAGCYESVVYDFRLSRRNKDEALLAFPLAMKSAELTHWRTLPSPPKTKKS
jgi:hypothetical protein